MYGVLIFDGFVKHGFVFLGTLEKLKQARMSERHEKISPNQERDLL
ncbi:MAG: hypothetical protein H7095_06160 [Pseudopedobacter sp.]|nr:hypothetical protein [Deinococcales bacterium]